MTLHDVTIIVPTFRRPAGLARAVRSIFSQDYAERFTLIIIDNDPDASATKVISELTEECPDRISLTAFNEPDAGVANARNRAMQAVDTRMVAFLDDDQSAPKRWLSNLLLTHSMFPAAVTFGPVRTVLPEHVRRHRAYLSDFFSRTRDIPSGFIDDYYGCGNALLDLELMPKFRPLFDPAMNESGGEDDVLFIHLKKLGCRFAWSVQASVYEHVPAQRARLGYTLKRAFSYGQGPCTMALRAQLPRYDKLAFWIAVGAAKALTNGLISAALFIARSPNRAIYLDRTARGLGKVFWWIDFSFYGAALLETRQHGRTQTQTVSVPVKA